MTSQVAVCNAALVHLGAATITSLSDNVKSARTLNTIYNAAIKNVLRKYPFKCAIKRTTLPALSEAPAWGFPYAYALPIDYLRVLAVGEFTYPSDAWSVEDGKILTYLSAPIKVKYIYNNETVSSWDAALFSVAAAYLAFYVAESITQDAEKRKEMFALFKDELSEARHQGAIEQSNLVLEANDWLDARE